MTRRVKACMEAALTEGGATIVTVEQTMLALFRVEGKCYAIANTCPHRGGPLGQGELDGFVVTCPWHGWEWDVRTGLNVRQPNTRVASFPVEIQDGEVFVILESSAGQKSLANG